MSTAIRVLKPEWTLIARSSCEYQIEGENVECWFTESAEKPTSAPDKNRAGTVAVATRFGGVMYEFRQVDGVSLWAYPKDNGCVVVIDDRGGQPIAQQIQYGALTAFSELKVAEYDPIGAWTFPYNINPRLIESQELNGGTVTHTGAFAQMQTGAAADGEASISTRKSVRYQPGVGGLVRFTATFTEGVADSQQLVGIGDDLDGLFFGYVGTEFGVLRRNNGTDFFTARSEWNELPFDALDPTKLNVYQIQYQWLGAGEIRFYIEFPGFGGFVLVHRDKYANTETDVSLQNPSLPLYAGVKNTGNTTNLTVRTPSGTSGLEGDSTNRSQRIIEGAAGTQSVGGTEVPIISISNPTTYEGIANRLTTRPVLVSIATAGTGNTLVRFFLRLNATLTGASFSPIDAASSPVEQDTAATALSGGTFVTATQIPIQDKLLYDLKDFEIQIAPGETLTVSAVSTGGTVSCGAAITLDTEA
jgi:hypothetical protein